MQGLGAIGIALQRLFHRLHLPGNASDAVEQLVFMFMNVRHTYTPYPYMARMVVDCALIRKIDGHRRDERESESDFNLL
ncbi:hypothetical protein GCM10009103_26190 [Pseudomonas koreensis]|nr:hypothetical protein GCM10009103_26190 [Pseudomonas koreensis]